MNEFLLTTNKEYNKLQQNPARSPDPIKAPNNSQQIPIQTLKNQKLTIGLLAKQQSLYNSATSSQTTLTIQKPQQYQLYNSKKSTQTF
jgi:hypothetical protein